MSVRKNVSVSLSPEPHAIVERMLASGRYGRFSKVMRTALRLRDAHERQFTPSGRIRHHAAWML